MTRFYSIRFRLTASFLVIIMAVMIIISIFLFNTLERYYMNNLEDNLARSGFWLPILSLVSCVGRLMQSA